MAFTTILNRPGFVGESLVRGTQAARAFSPMEA